MKLRRFYRNKYNDLESYFDRVVSREKEYEFDGKIILYRTLPAEIEQNNKNLVFIHGWGSSMLNWYFQLSDEVFSRYNVFLIDLPGHGRNKDFSNMGEVTFESYYKVLKEFVRECVSSKEVVGIGHSMGGCLTKLLFNRKVLNEAVYINPSMELDKNIGIFNSKLFHSLLRNKRMIGGKLVDKIVRNVFTMKVWSRLLDDRHSNTFSISSIITVADMLQTEYYAFWGFLLNMLNNYPSEISFDKLTKAELFIFSKNDITLPYDKVIHKVDSTRIKVLDSGGHCTPRTNYEKINQLIKNFIVNKYE